MQTPRTIVALQSAISRREDGPSKNARREPLRSQGVAAGAPPAILRFFLPGAWRVVEPTLMRHADQIRGVRVAANGALCVELRDNKGFIVWRPEPREVEELIDAATGLSR